MNLIVEHCLLIVRGTVKKEEKALDGKQGLPKIDYIVEI